MQIRGKILGQRHRDTTVTCAACVSALSNAASWHDGVLGGKSGRQYWANYVSPFLLTATLSHQACRSGSTCRVLALFGTGPV